MTHAISRVQASVILSSTVLSDVDGLDKVFKCAKAALDLFSEFISPLSEGLVALGNCVESCRNVMSPFQVLKTVKDWYDVENRNWAGRMNLICVTALTAIGIGKFLEDIKLFDMGGYVTKLGKIPVLGNIIHVPLKALDLGIAVLNIADTSIKVHTKEKPDFKKTSRELSSWVMKKTVFNTPRDSLVDHSVDLRMIEEWNKNNPHFEATAKSKDSPDKYIAQANAYLDYKISVLRVEKKNNRVELRKSVFSIVADISKVVFLSLGLVGSVFGVTAISFTTVPMLALSLLVCIIGVGKKFYDTAHKDVEKTPEMPDVVRKFIERMDKKKAKAEKAEAAKVALVPVPAASSAVSKK